MLLASDDVHVPRNARMPNCIVIGAPRSGSTTLYEGLRRHPDVFMSPNKEPGYFRHVPSPELNTGPGDDLPIRIGVTELHEYQALFDGVTHEAIRGEASVVYLGSAKAADAIRPPCQTQSSSLCCATRRTGPTRNSPNMCYRDESPSTHLKLPYRRNQNAWRPAGHRSGATLSSGIMRAIWNSILNAFPGSKSESSSTTIWQPIPLGSSSRFIAF